MKVEIISETREYDGFFKIDRAVLRHERFDGTMSEEITRFNFSRGDSVGILLYNPEEEAVILIEQFRYPAYVNDGPGWLLEIVAGMRDRERDVVTVAHAELLEEAGYKVEELEPITTFYPTPGGSSERMHLYFGRVTRGAKVAAGGGVAYEHEDIRTLKIPLKRALAMIESGEICEAKTIIALQWLALREQTR